MISFSFTPIINIDKALTDHKAIASSLSKCSSYKVSLSSLCLPLCQLEIQFACNISPTFPELAIATLELDKVIDGNSSTSILSLNIQSV